MPPLERPSGQKGSRIDLTNDDMGERTLEKMQIARLERRMKELKASMRKLQATNSDEKELYKKMTEEILKLGQDLEFVNAIYNKNFQEKKEKIYKKQVKSKIKDLYAYPSSNGPNSWREAPVKERVT